MDIGADGLVKATSRLQQLDGFNGEDVAAFDADGVLWHGDVSEDFTRWMIGRGHFDGALWDPYSRVNATDPAAGCLAILEFYRGMAIEHLTTHVREFWRAGGARIWIEPVVAALRRLEAQGCSIYVVSGTPRPVLDPLAEHLPVEGERILALELEVDAGGRATGRHRGVPTCGAGKAQALRSRAVGPVRLAVGNSVLDVEMLELSEDVRWVIEPDAGLREIAEHKGWLITDSKGREHE